MTDDEALRDLGRGVLSQAIHDLKYRQTPEQDKYSARAFLLSTDDPNSMFPFWCHVADADPDRMRVALRRRFGGGQAA